MINYIFQKYEFISPEWISQIYLAHLLFFTNHTIFTWKLVAKFLKDTRVSVHPIVLIAMAQNETLSDRAGNQEHSNNGMQTNKYAI